MILPTLPFITKSPIQFTSRSSLEIAKHNKKDDAWVVIDGNVYDVTKYVDLHPGGWLPIATLAGKDCTDAFANYHPARVYKNLLPQYLIGTMKGYTVTEFQSGHRAIRQLLLEKGLFEIRPSFFIKLGIWLAFFQMLKHVLLVFVVFVEMFGVLF